MFVLCIVVVSLNFKQRCYLCDDECGGLFDTETILCQRWDIGSKHRYVDTRHMTNCMFLNIVKRIFLNYMHSMV
jgi:hypothetical protein